MRQRRGSRGGKSRASPSLLATERSSLADPVVRYVHGLPSDGTVLERQVQSGRGTVAHVQTSLHDAFMSIFMPQGYPDSVSADYREYQIWDSLQAFCSYTTSTIATKATLEGMGVGSGDATAATALVTWILKDGAGMLGRIGFAWAQGNDLDNNAKQWRLVADCCDDFARVIQLLAPNYPAYFRIIMCFVSVVHAVVGVAGGATRNAVTQHQARRNNAGDVAAKDGSQETMVTLCGLVLGLYLVPLLDGFIYETWALMLLGSACHIYANYRAVSCLQFDTFNERRAMLAIDTYLSTGPDLLSRQASSGNDSDADWARHTVPTPAEMAGLEPIFSGFLPNSRSQRVHIGCPISDLDASRPQGPRYGTSLQQLLADAGGANADSACHILGLGRDSAVDWQSELEYMQGAQLYESYVVVIHRDAPPDEALKGLFHACWCRQFPGGGEQHAHYLVAWADFQAKCEAVGWRTDKLQLPDRGWRAEWRPAALDEEGNTNYIDTARGRSPSPATRRR